MKYLIKYYPIEIIRDGCCGNEHNHERVLTNIKEFIAVAGDPKSAEAMFHIMVKGKIVSIEKNKIED